MLKFEKILETATKRMGQILIKEKYCSKLNSSLSRCSKCVEICPVNGIEINKKDIKFNEDCIECGLCAGKCPTGAISIQEPTELNLYKYIEKKGKEDSLVAISCKYNGDISPTYRVPCLGSLTLDFLLGIDVLPFNIHMIFSKDKCNNCIGSKGIKVFLDNMAQIKKIEDDLELKGGAIRTVEEAEKIKKARKKDIHDTDIERREFLLSIFKFAKKIPNKAIEYVFQEDSKEKSREIVLKDTYRRHSFFKKVVLDLKEKRLDEKKVEVFLKPISAANCNFCRACVMLCPMGALKYLAEDKTLKIDIINDACSGCGLCVDVCYPKALELNPKTIGDFYDAESKVLVRGTIQKCQACGEDIKSSESVKLCSSCIKSGKI